MKEGRRTERYEGEDEGRGGEEVRRRELGQGVGNAFDPDIYP